MPVRSLISPVLKWPDLATVDRAARIWAGEMAAQHPELIQAGYFGSYARGDWGVGSDLDLLAVVTFSPEPCERRALSWDQSRLPVPADLLIYTEEEWQRLQAQGGRFAQTVAREAVWVYPAPP